MSGKTSQNQAPAQHAGGSLISEADSPLTYLQVDHNLYLPAGHSRASLRRRLVRYLKPLGLGYPPAESIARRKKVPSPNTKKVDRWLQEYRVAQFSGNSSRTLDLPVSGLLARYRPEVVAVEVFAPTSGQKHLVFHDRLPDPAVRQVAKRLSHVGQSPAAPDVVASDPDDRLITLQYSNDPPLALTTKTLGDAARFIAGFMGDFPITGPLFSDFKVNLLKRVDERVLPDHELSDRLENLENEELVQAAEVLGEQAPERVITVRAHGDLRTETMFWSRGGLRAGDWWHTHEQSFAYDFLRVLGRAVDGEPSEENRIGQLKTFLRLLAQESVDEIFLNDWSRADLRFAVRLARFEQALQHLVRVQQAFHRTVTLDLPGSSPETLENETEAIRQSLKRLINRMGAKP